MKTKQLLVYGLILICFTVATSCSKEIGFTGEELDPKLVVNALCSPDSTITVEVSSTRTIPGFELQYRFIHDATVKLFVDGEETEQLTCINAADSTYANSSSTTLVARYKSTTIARSGAKYQIKVSHRDFDKTVTGEMVIVQRVPIIKASTSVSNNTDINDYSEKKIEAVLQFSDPAEEENYYCLNICYRIGKGTDYANESDNSINRVQVMDYYIQHIIESSDPVLSNSTNTDNVLFESSDYGYTTFDDKLINGKRYNLSFNIHKDVIDDLVNTDTLNGSFYIITFELQTLNKDAYYYLKSVGTLYNSNLGFFAEPVQVYSNVTNGVGIVGSYSSSVYMIQQGQYPKEGTEYYYGSISY